MGLVRITVFFSAVVCTGWQCARCWRSLWCRFIGDCYHVSKASAAAAVSTTVVGPSVTAARLSLHLDVIAASWSLWSLTWPLWLTINSSQHCAVSSGV